MPSFFTTTLLCLGVPPQPFAGRLKRRRSTPPNGYIDPPVEADRWHPVTALLRSARCAVTRWTCSSTGHAGIHAANHGQAPRRSRRTAPTRGRGRGVTVSELTREAIETLLVAPQGRRRSLLRAPVQADAPTSPSASRRPRQRGRLIALIVDAGPLYAELTRRPSPHRKSRALETHAGPLIVPTLVVTEVVYLLGRASVPTPRFGFSEISPLAISLSNQSQRRTGCESLNSSHSTEICHSEPSMISDRCRRATRCQRHRNTRSTPLHRRRIQDRQPASPGLVFP